MQHATHNSSRSYGTDSELTWTNSPAALTCAGKRVVVYTYIFGAYDRLDASDMVLPNGVDGFFYTHPGECDQATAASLRRSGWQVVFTPPLAATKHTAGNRLTSKRHKWLWPWEVQGYDYVLTHDGNVRIDYSRLRCFIQEHMARSSVDVLLKDWYKGWMETQGWRRSVYMEIDNMLTQRPEFVASSREKVVEWRAFLKDSGYEDKDYFETDIMLFRPTSSAFARAGRRTFERCHEVPRDQFILPWAIEKEGVRYSRLSEPDLQRLLGYRKLLDLRSGRN